MNLNSKEITNPPALNYSESSKLRLKKDEQDSLKSRLEEQSRLITFYKNRGDEYSRKNVNLEKLNHDLVEQKAFKFLKIDQKHAQRENEMIQESVKRITEVENEMMKGMCLCIYKSIRRNTVFRRVSGFIDVFQGL